MLKNHSLRGEKGNAKDGKEYPSLVLEDTAAYDST